MSDPVIISVRGPNGSGKSYLVQQLMSTSEIRTEMNWRTPVVELVKINTYVIQCDSIDTEAETKYLVSKYHALGHVVFEGVRMSTIFGPWLEFSRQHNGMIWAFMDTPLDVCVRRVQARNGGKPVKENLMRDKWNTNKRIIGHAQRASERVVILPWENPLPVLAGMLTTDTLHTHTPPVRRSLL